MRQVVLAAVLMVLAAPAMAEPPGTSLRPMARPALLDLASAPVAAPAAAAAAGPQLDVAGSVPISGPVLRPRMRPAGLVSLDKVHMVSAATASTSAAAAPAVVPALARVLRPAKRPNGLGQPLLASAPVQVAPGGKTSAPVSRKGSVCGDPAIKGVVLAPITSGTRGCGVAEPVRITSVAGVALSQAATMDCPTAKALRNWIERGVNPAYGKGKVVELQIAGHYICRTRNHRSGAKISEHGKGRAIDVSGFTLSNGKTVTVAANFDRKMRKAHKAACGIFGTTLGPGSDGMHEDHLHFDTARHRNGAYCR